MSRIPNRHPAENLSVKGWHAPTPVGAATFVKDILGVGDIGNGAVSIIPFFRGCIIQTFRFLEIEFPVTVVDGIATSGEHTVLQRVGGLQQVVA